MVGGENVRDVQEIDYILDELENTHLKLDEYMKGFTAALKWVLSESTLAEDIAKLPRGLL